MPPEQDFQGLPRDIKRIIVDSIQLDRIKQSHRYRPKGFWETGAEIMALHWQQWVPQMLFIIGLGIAAGLAAYGIIYYVGQLILKLGGWE